MIFVVHLQLYVLCSYGRFAYGSFRLRSVRLRLESIRLRLICQFAYVLKHVLPQFIHLLYVRSRSGPSQSIQFLERDSLPYYYIIIVQSACVFCIINNQTVKNMLFLRTLVELVT